MADRVSAWHSLCERIQRRLHYAETKDGSSHA
jgi:hypothetical protein